MKPLWSLELDLGYEENRLKDSKIVAKLENAYIHIFEISGQSRTGIFPILDCLMVVLVLKTIVNVSIVYQIPLLFILFF